MPDRLFLDANVLFSAAYRASSGLSRLWRLEDVVLIASTYAIAEARRNLPDAERLARLDALLEGVEQVGEVVDRPLPPDVVLPDKDRPILLAALAASASHLLTGDVSHFGAYFGRNVVGVRILRPAEYLREQGG